VSVATLSVIGRSLEIAAELVRVKVDVIVVSADVGIAAVRRETRTIPIVMANSTDLVGTRFVASLAHPGGNVTGVSNISADLRPGSPAWRFS
jgi:putative ABC transport system substrate-binding protein